MASARSTVSIARTTPAQKPRGEHNSTFSCGFSEGREDVMSVSFRGLRPSRNRRIWFPAHAPVKHARRRKAKFHCDTDEQAAGTASAWPVFLNLFIFP